MLKQFWIFQHILQSDVRPIAANIIEPIETIYNGLQSDIDITDITSNFMSKEAVFLVVSMLVMLL